MNSNKEGRAARSESSYYEMIKERIEEILREKTPDCYVEITASRKFSNKLKAQINPHGHKDIIFHFLREAAPDVTGFIKRENSSDVIIVEVKDNEMKVDDIYQTRKYAELFSAKYALLVSTREIPEEIKRLSKVVYQLLSGGYGHEKMVLAYFNPVEGRFAEWFEKNPFV